MCWGECFRERRGCEAPRGGGWKEGKESSNFLREPLIINDRDRREWRACFRPFHHEEFAAWMLLQSGRSINENATQPVADDGR